jgi:hypothetical protein
MEEMKKLAEMNNKAMEENNALLSVSCPSTMLLQHESCSAAGSRTD